MLATKTMRRLSRFLTAHGGALLWLALVGCQGAGRPVGRIFDVPLFHNSTTAYTLPPNFHDSASTLLAKHAAVARVPTLCGLVTREPAAAPA